jgi:GNAT superfamily N-acetyltransferase
MNVVIEMDSTIETDEVIDLYRANPWSSANHPELLVAALRNSHTLATARIDNRLVGLANAISDGFMVVYFPHMLVHPDYHRHGIGRKLMQAMQSVYSSFHQQMLTADVNAVSFYNSVGFKSARETRSMWIYQGDEH